LNLSNHSNLNKGFQDKPKDVKRISQTIAISTRDFKTNLKMSNLKKTNTTNRKIMVSKTLFAPRTIFWGFSGGEEGLADHFQEIGPPIALKKLLN